MLQKKHAAQLEKWVTQYIEENEVSPKGNANCKWVLRYATE